MRAGRLLLLGFVLLSVAESAALAAHGIYCPNPGLDCTHVLVVPVKYVPPYCPDPTQPCIDTSMFHDPPRLPAWQLQSVLDNRVNPNFSDWSFGTWQYQYDILVNPGSADGWWPMPASLQDYEVSLNSGGDFWHHGPAARAIVEDAIEGIAAPASMEGLIPSLATYNRLVIIDNNHGRGGQTTEVTYNVPVQLPGFDIWLTVPHLFTASWMTVESSDDFLEPLASHELTHQLGPGDFYGPCLVSETPLGSFTDECNGPWDVMASDLAGPNHPTAYNKVALGWLPFNTLHVQTLPVVGSGFWTSVAISPIEDLDFSQIRLVRVPLAQPLQDGPFDGYHLECRRKILGDGLIPEEGVLIQRVREAAPGVAENAGMPARVVRADPPFDDVAAAALQPGETWVDSPHGLSVSFVDYADGTPQGACQVEVAYTDTGTHPDPAFKIVDGLSTDLWMDSPDNGLNVYPPSQPLDVDGTPAGPGDPFAVGATNVLRYHVRNLGTAPTPTLAVRFTAEQPPHVACGPPPPRILDVVEFVPSIPPGGMMTESVDLFVPKAQPIRVQATIAHVPFEMTTSNNKAERVFITGSGSSLITVDGPAAVALDVEAVNGCPQNILMRAVPKTLQVLPIPDPDPIFDRWMAPDSGLIQVASGETKRISLSFAPPGAATPGSGVAIPISFLQGGGPAVQGGLYGEAGREIDSLTLSVPVVGPSMLTVARPPNPCISGQPLTVSGTLTPGVDGTALGLRLLSPSRVTTVVPVATDSRGTFVGSFVPDETGGWTVQVSWPGDETRVEALSPAMPFVVAPLRPCTTDPACDDGNPCTADRCDRGTGACVYALEADGTACDDGNRCTTGGSCLAGSCGQPVVCDDGDPCTADTCDPATGQCTFHPPALEQVSSAVFSSADVLTWAPAAGASYWNTYRGTIPPGLMGSRRSPYDEGCFESADLFEDGVLVTTDASAPSVGTAWYYEITEKTMCGEGPAGMTSQGTLHTPPGPCLPQ